MFTIGSVHDSLGSPIIAPPPYQLMGVHLNLQTAGPEAVSHPIPTHRDRLWGTAEQISWRCGVRDGAAVFASTVLVSHRHVLNVLSRLLQRSE